MLILKKGAVQCSVCHEEMKALPGRHPCSACGKTTVVYDVGQSASDAVCGPCATYKGDGIGHANVCEGKPRTNPASVVKTKRDERLWEAAKAAWAEKKPKPSDKWAYIMATFQRMKNRTGGARKNPRDLPHRSMTYGVLPSRASFEQHYAAHMADTPGGYEIVVRGKHTPLISSGVYDEDELWHLVKALKAGWEEGDEDAGDWASSILGTLGFEWI